MERRFPDDAPVSENNINAFSNLKKIFTHVIPEPGSSLLPIYYLCAKKTSICLTKESR
jgi:hypothetical protein